MLAQPAERELYLLKGYERLPFLEYNQPFMEYNQCFTDDGNSSVTAPGNVAVHYKNYRGYDAVAYKTYFYRSSTAQWLAWFD